MTTLDVLFGAVGLITAASAVLAVTTQHLVHAALWLVVTLGTLAGCYLILGAELVALVQLLVYVGAVVVLVLFALMLTRAPMGRSPEHSSSAVQRVAAAVIGAGTTALFASVLLPALGGELRATRVADTTQSRAQFQCRPTRRGSGDRRRHHRAVRLCAATGLGRRASRDQSR